MSAPLQFTLDGCKSYATAAKLQKKLESMNALRLPHLLCKNDEGRHTAVFFGRDANYVIFEGFKWIMGYDTHTAA